MTHPRYRFSCTRTTAVLATVAALALTGCGAEAPGAQPKSLQATEPTTPGAVEKISEPAPTPEAEEPPAVGPILPATCEEVIPLEVVKGYSEYIEFMDTGAAVEPLLENRLGPATMAALQGGSQQIYCSWGIPQSDGGVDLGLAAISDQTAADLTSALRDSVYVELDAIGEEVVFDQGPSSEHRYLDTIIIGDGLLVVSTGTLQGNFARDAWDLVTGRTE